MLPNLQGISLYLIGMMGSGKTTIGKLLADRFEYQFFDTDQLLSKSLNNPLVKSLPNPVNRCFGS